MTSDNDDLEAALRNLKLRSELAANVAKAEATASQRGGASYRLGWVLYWACLALAGGWLLLFAVWLGAESATISEAVSRIAWAPLAFLIWFGIPALALYGIGRVFRYVLSGE